jgi:predicted ester cyclase
MSEVEQNKDLIRRYMSAVWNGVDVERDFYAPDAAIHTSPSPSGVPNTAQTAAYFRAALPNLSLRNTMVFGQEDRVWQHYTVTGTHTGAPLFDFPPTGRELTLAGANIFRIHDGKIVEQWSIIDAADVFQQLSANQGGEPR